MVHKLSTATQLDAGWPGESQPPLTSPVAQATDGGRTHGGSLDLGNMNLFPGSASTRPRDPEELTDCPYVFSPTKRV